MGSVHNIMRLCTLSSLSLLLFVFGCNSRGGLASSEGDGGESGLDAPHDPVSLDMLCIEAKMACGRCGELTISCTDGGAIAGACMGEGACSPGTWDETPSKCMERPCRTNCSWDIWRLKAGKQCETGSRQTCMGPPCSGSGHQDCVDCRWTACRC